MTDSSKDLPEKPFADVSDILARKAEGRRVLSALTFGEKIARMEALRERLSPFKRIREARREQAPSLSDETDSGRTSSDQPRGLS